MDRDASAQRAQTCCPGPVSSGFGLGWSLSGSSGSGSSIGGMRGFSGSEGSIAGGRGKGSGMGEPGIGGSDARGKVAPQLAKLMRGTKPVTD
ncbi:hypothetical protein CHELA20_51218 [Hyphomicrobiales bacterium]|nr:hypothetical protein CHELA41_23794 [Hyphomicrobiales bacterium]CAH1674515.1 hypothetical protein CHELA20_51218 [Hyphomicrobiales bacterium]